MTRKMETYQELRERHQREVNAFPMKWAFSQEQLERGMRELGLEPDQMDAVVAIPGGGFIRKTDKQAFIDMFKRHKQERAEALASDVDGMQYAYQMFLYELANHEYCITYSVDDTLEACGLTAEDVNASPVLRKALAKAIEDYLEKYDSI